MFREYYVTIAIVAVCVAALIYLIYMTTKLLGEPGEMAPNTEMTTPSTSGDAEEDNTYFFNNEGRTEGSDQTGSQDDVATTGSDDYSNYDYENGEDLDKGRSASGNTTTVAPEEMDTESDGIAEEDFSARTGDVSSSGRGSTASAGAPYMVIAGTFGNKANAQEMERKLRDMSYYDVSLEPFDRGKYTVVLVGRFNSLSEAKSLVNELKGKGVDAYVKRK